MLHGKQWHWKWCLDFALINGVVPSKRAFYRAINGTHISALLSKITLCTMGMRHPKEKTITNWVIARSFSIFSTETSSDVIFFVAIIIAALERVSVSLGWLHFYSFQHMWLILLLLEKFFFISSSPMVPDIWSNICSTSKYKYLLCLWRL